MSAKYPRTPHLPWSPGGTRDDRKIESLDSLIGVELVITEKIDGSNICFTKENVFARSHAGAPTHASFALAKAKQAEVALAIDFSMSVFCEYTYAIHSIEYTDMKSQFWLFGMRDARQEGTVWADFSTLEHYGKVFNIPVVPAEFRGKVQSEDELREIVESIMQTPSNLGGEKEGVVVRYAYWFYDEDFSNKVAKYVRKDHVQTDEHWSRNWKKQVIK